MARDQDTARYFAEIKLELVLEHGPAATSDQIRRQLAERNVNRELYLLAHGEDNRFSRIKVRKVSVAVVEDRPGQEKLA